MTRGDDYRVYAGPPGFRQFVRLFLAVRRQPQFQRYTGPLTWLTYLALLPSAYLFSKLRGQPHVIIVEDASSRLLAGIMITRDGWLRNFVAFQGSREGARASLRGYEELQRLQHSPSFRTRTLRIRTAATNVSLIRMLRRIGYEPWDTPSYLVTAPLGPFRYSWVATSKPKHRLFHVEQQVLLVRTPIPDPDRDDRTP